MKIVSKKFSTLIYALLSGLLGLIGYSCGDEESLMYGTPTGSYEIKGTVTDDEGNPVEGAKVTVGDVDSPKCFNLDSTITDSKGEYLLNGQITTFNEKYVRMGCTPKGEDLNSETGNIKLIFKGGDGSWYYGEAEARKDFQLKKK